MACVHRLTWSLRWRVLLQGAVGDVRDGERGLASALGTPLAVLGTPPGSPPRQSGVKTLPSSAVEVGLLSWRGGGVWGET